MAKRSGLKLKRIALSLVAVGLAGAVLVGVGLAASEVVAVVGLGLLAMSLHGLLFTGFAACLRTGYKARDRNGEDTYLGFIHHAIRTTPLAPTSSDAKQRSSSPDRQHRRERSD